MAKELQYYGKIAQTGLTVIARVYDPDGVQVGADVSCPEVGTLAIYIGNMPAAAKAQYGIRFFSGTTLLGQGIIFWDGTEEVFPSSFDPATDTVAQVTLVDTVTTNTDMRGTDDALLAANYTAPDNATIAIIETQVDEVHKIHGLSAGNPMTVTPSSRTVTGINQDITGDGATTTTVTRA